MLFMKILTLIFCVFMSTNSIMLFDFSNNVDIKDWRIVNDDVMGGKSTSDFMINKDGHGVFKGVISLKNNGGFSSVRYRFKNTEVKDLTKIVIRLRGDGKTYQFRVKPNRNTYFSYIYNFDTNNNWQEIEIPLKDMYPSFRGRRLNRGNFSSEELNEIAFLIGNKKEENFELIIDKIELK